VELEERLQRMQEQLSGMVDPGVHESVRRQMDGAIRDRGRAVEEVELKNVIDSLDGGQRQVSDLHAQLADLTNENEELRGHIENLRRELTLAETALKDRNKELLALERELMRQRQIVAIVKDSIPAPPKRLPIGGPDGRFLTEALRTGLSEMQCRLLGNRAVI
jgi:septal ring factor EnvC (AmiA/AmiB activator)